MFRIFLLVLCMCFTAIACEAERNSDRSSPDSEPEVKAADDIHQSFSVDRFRVRGQALDNKDHFPQISIAKSALDREFVLYSSLVVQPVVPSWQGLKTRVVAFKRVDDTLYLLEASKGHQVTPSIPQDLLLTSFPILEEDEDSIAFDFAEGFNRIFVAGDWYGQDFGGADYQDSWMAVPTTLGYVKEAVVDSRENLLEVDHVALVESSSSTPVRVKYRLQPYRANPTFKPTKSHSFDHVGFFEVAPQFDDSGETVVYASKFDSSKPIVFAISANTPAEYKQAVVDGVTYWNKAFGREVVHVIDAPEGLSGPSYDYNIVQWVEWDQAGFAYADAQSDPRTGEIKHAQVFMTSVFAVSNLNKARKLLRKLKAKGEADRSRKTISLKGFQNPLREIYSFEEKKFEQTLDKLIKAGADDSVYQRFAQDSIREVIAHEIGHTLGLRHNFAGSLATTITPERREQAMEAYLVNGYVNDVTSSSVMDYLVSLDSVVVGRNIAMGNESLSYDQKAIQRLYNDIHVDPNNEILFCTDSHATSFLDCRRFDIGRSVTEAIVADIETVKSIPNDLAETFIWYKSPAYGLAKSVGEVPLFPSVATGPVDGFYSMVMSILDESMTIAGHRAYPVVDLSNYNDVRNRELDIFFQETEKVGGLEGLLGPVLNLDASGLSANFSSLIESEHYRKGIAPSGEGYEFSDAEVETMKARVAAVSAPIVKELLLAELEVYSNITSRKLADHPVAEKFVGFLGSRMKKMLTHSEENIVGILNLETDESDSPEALSVTLPKFILDYDTRVEVIELMSYGQSVDPSWNLRLKETVKNAFENFVETTLALPPHKIKSTAQSDRDVRRWVYEIENILSSLGSDLMTRVDLDDSEESEKLPVSKDPEEPKDDADPVVTIKK